MIACPIMTKRSGQGPDAPVVAKEAAVHAGDAVATKKPAASGSKRRSRCRNIGI
jgi:hypothetical protein